MKGLLFCNLRSNFFRSHKPASLVLLCRAEIITNITRFCPEFLNFLNFRPLIVRHIRDDYLAVGEVVTFVNLARKWRASAKSVVPPGPGLRLCCRIRNAMKWHQLHAMSEADREMWRRFNKWKSDYVIRHDKVCGCAWTPASPRSSFQISGALEHLSCPTKHSFILCRNSAVVFYLVVCFVSEMMNDSLFSNLEQQNLKLNKYNLL